MPQMLVYERLHRQNIQLILLSFSGTLHMLYYISIAVAVLIAGIPVQKAFGSIFEDGWPYWLATIVLWSVLAWLGFNHETTLGFLCTSCIIAGL